MEHLDFGGKRYIKVSSAARETGYTSDYIGQLCRAKKIDAKLVGRTWYVAQEELASHKRTRGRSSYEKTRKAVRSVIEDRSETVIPIHRGAAPEYRKRLVEAKVEYHPDQAELIPTLMSRNNAPHAAHIRVHEERGVGIPTITTNAPAHVAVAEEEDVQVKFNTSEPKEVKWNGTIVVSPIEEQQTVEEPKRSTYPLEKHLHFKTEKERNNKVNIDVSDVAHDPLDAQKRFLERMNLAHDLNKIHHVATKMRRAVGQEPVAGVPFPRRSTLRESEPLPERVALGLQNKVSEKSARPSRTPVLLATAALFLSLGFFMSGTFISSEHHYESKQIGTSSALSYGSGIYVQSAAEALKAAYDVISDIRDNYILSQ